MPWFLSTSIAVGRLVSHKNSIKQLMKYSKNNLLLGNFVQIRCLSSIAFIEAFSSAKVGNYYKDDYASLGRLCNRAIQRRGFLGCGDGEEGNVLSKLYEEKRVMG